MSSKPKAKKLGPVQTLGKQFFSDKQDTLYQQTTLIKGNQKQAPLSHKVTNMPIRLKSVTAQVLSTFSRRKIFRWDSEILKLSARPKDFEPDKKMEIATWWQNPNKKTFKFFAKIRFYFISSKLKERNYVECKNWQMQPTSAR